MFFFGVAYVTNMDVLTLNEFIASCLESWLVNLPRPNLHLLRNKGLIRPYFWGGYVYGRLGWPVIMKRSDEQSQVVADGSNPAPVEVGSLSHYSRVFLCIPLFTRFLLHPGGFPKSSSMLQYHKITFSTKRRSMFGGIVLVIILDFILQFAVIQGLEYQAPYLCLSSPVGNSPK